MSTLSELLPAAKPLQGSGFAAGKSLLKVLKSALQGRQPSQGTLGRSQTARGGFSPTPWLAPHTASRKAPGAPLGTARARWGSRGQRLRS